MVAKLNLSKLSELFKENDLPLSQIQLNQFEIYYNELLKWNPKANLISKNDESRIVERHFLESALFSLLNEFQGGLSVLDLGTGGGFPGIPLQIVTPDLQLTLLDSKRWKGLFLKHLIEVLELQNTEVLCERAEAAAENEEYRNRFDRVVCRAVTDLSALYRLSRPFLKSGGNLVALKGSRLNNELNRFKAEYPGVSFEVKPFPGTGVSHLKNLCLVIIRMTS
ncbi:16S rRNA (guanine(527)-N(7))-methyltransferase RsmG [candidate division KSB1 bacterium]|nr:16S rRNA (guanine(527)-N(7))-methyltransferase RsmG [candidate division KSB1 bacterium]MCH8980406.1 16S rRNA (guanine(527)-N(7))-methyltransferase RsmG [candidate division KSB1 bacterium]